MNWSRFIAATAATWSVRGVPHRELALPQASSFDYLQFAPARMPPLRPNATTNPAAAASTCLRYMLRLPFCGDHHACGNPHYGMPFACGRCCRQLFPRRDPGRQ